ncbi:MAG: TPM domain-containing protein [Candidatus Omnitrophica bacterium]|nr:TPM domain-containing protein [Candidatus Omnitrophota bacterium]
MLYRLTCKLILLLVLISGRPVFGADQIPAAVGWVNDFANVISADHNAKLTALIIELREKTGAEIMVITVSSIAPYDEKEYARLIFDKWKPGKKGRDNGVLVLLAVKERRWRIETGYGLESILPDGKCGEIGRNYMVPYFKEGDYDTGIFYGVGQIIKVIANEAKINISNIESIDPQAGKGNLNLTYFSLYIFLFCLIWNVPWPIFIGLPFTILFSLGMALSQGSIIIVISALLGYFIAMIVRYGIWLKMSTVKRKSFLQTLIWGLPVGSGGSYSGGSFGGGGR